MAHASPVRIRSQAITAETHSLHNEAATARESELDPENMKSMSKLVHTAW